MNAFMDQKLEENLALYLQFEKRNGLLPVIVQDYQSGEVLMLAYTNQEAFEQTLETVYATFWSTSRNELWVKCGTSGDFLSVVEIYPDCDQDALLYKVEIIGNGTCHTKNFSGTARKTCFYRRLKNNTMEFVEGLK